jgi:hypothetical protein
MVPFEGDFWPMQAYSNNEKGEFAHPGQMLDTKTILQEKTPDRKSGVECYVMTSGGLAAAVA